DLPAASAYDVSAELPGFADARAEKVSAREAGLVLRLSSESSLAGVVVDSGGKPVPNYELWARPLADGAPGLGARGHSSIRDRGGAFALRALPAGSYELGAFTERGQLGRLTVSLAAGEAKSNLRLR